MACLQPRRSTSSRTPATSRSRSRSRPSGATPAWWWQCTSVKDRLWMGQIILASFKYWQVRQYMYGHWYTMQCLGPSSSTLGQSRGRQTILGVPLILFPVPYHVPSSINLWLSQYTDVYGIHVLLERRLEILHPFMKLQLAEVRRLSPLAVALLSGSFTRCAQGPGLPKNKPGQVYNLLIFLN